MIKHVCMDMYRCAITHAQEVIRDGVVVESARVNNYYHD